MKNKLLLFICCVIFSINYLSAQTVSLRVIQVSHSTADPAGAGPATGSVLIKFELSSNTAGILADGIPFSMLYQ